MTSSRMTSTRTVGNEAGNGDGEFNYYASNGVNYLLSPDTSMTAISLRYSTTANIPALLPNKTMPPFPFPIGVKAAITETVLPEVSATVFMEPAA